MKKSEMKMVMIIILVGVVIIGLIAIFKGGKKENNNNVNSEVQNTVENEVVEEYVQKLDDGTKLNVSEELSKTKTLDGLEITNIQLTSYDGSTNLLADVKNTASTTSSYRRIKIEALDKNGEVITDFVGVINDVEPGETVHLNAWVSGDAANAYDFRVSEIEE